MPAIAFPTHPTRLAYVSTPWTDPVNGGQWLFTSYSGNRGSWAAYVAPGGGGGATNLSTTAAPTTVTINSDTGTDAVIAAADGTNAGLMVPAQFTKLAGIATGATAAGATGDAYATSHEADTTAHTAANIVNVASGTIAATTVQAALNELDSEKLATATAASTYAPVATTVTLAGAQTITGQKRFNDGITVSNGTEFGPPKIVSGASSGSAAEVAILTGNAGYFVLTQDPSGILDYLPADSLDGVVAAENGGTGVSVSGTTAQIAVGGGTTSPIVWTTATGTGAPVRGSTPTLTTPVLNGTPTGTGVASAYTASTLVLRDGSGGITGTTGTFTQSIAATTVTAGDSLINSGAATVGAQRYSPATLWTGAGWKTTDTAASQPVAFRSYVVPVQGAANPSANWTLESSINGGAYAFPLTYSSSGSLAVNYVVANGYISSPTHYTQNNNGVYVTGASNLTGLSRGGVDGTWAMGNGTAGNASGSLLLTNLTASGTVVVGGSTINANAVLDVQSTTKAFMPPRMTTTQKNALASPTAGMIVYDTTLNKLCVYTTSWETITSL